MLKNQSKGQSWLCNKKVWIRLFIVLLCYISFVAADFLFEQEMASRRALLHSENSNIAHSLSDSVSRTFDQADGILLFMKTAIETSGKIAPAHQELLKSICSKGVFDQIAVADPKGDLTFSAAPMNRPINITNREHFQVHTKDDINTVFIAPTRQTEVVGRPVIFLSRRINNAKGEFAGIVSIGIAQEYFHKLFRQMDIEPKNSIVLLRDDGTFLARVPALKSDEQMDRFKQHPAISYVAQGMTNGGYETEGGEVGSPRIGAFSVVADYPALILVAIEKVDAFQEIVERHRIYRLWAIVFSCLVVLGVLAVEILASRQHKTSLALSAEHERACQYLSQMEKQKVEVEMARLDRLSLIGEMAASIGHEVRNPLTTVRGYLQLFQRKKEYSQQAEQIALMIEELDRANSIITEFLSLAKNKRVDFISITLNEIIIAITPLLQADAIREGKTIMLQLEDVPPLLVDKNEIRQLILNLVRNSLDAMQAGGVVTIRLYADKQDVLLAVQDTGSGILPSVYEKLGMPFLTTKENGTGLGLVVCYKIAEHHQAKIEVETSPRGTTFIVRFTSGDSAAL